jgi:L-amino acid N-acyltransferase YncA
MLEHHIYDFDSIIDYAFVRGYSRFTVYIDALVADFKTKYTDVYIPSQHDHIVIAVGRGGEAIGFIVWKTEPAFPNKTAFIGLSWVTENWRKRGIYKEMLKRVCDIAARQNCTKVMLAVDGANDLSIAVHDAILGTPSMIVYSASLTLKPEEKKRF